MDIGARKDAERISQERQDSSASASAAPRDQLLSYSPHLDGLRCVAVSLVVWQHLGSGPLIAGLGLNGIGTYGVWLFFVISGFLITRILLVARASVERGAIARPRAMLTFYARRVLRIFPPYYALLLVLLVFPPPQFREEFWWHAGYLSNWLFAIQGNWSPGVGHFWSLAVEEQFYLVWPLLLLWTPMRRLPLVLLLMAAIGPVGRAISAMVGDWSLHVLVPTMNSFDCLAIGALLAWHVVVHPEREQLRMRWLRMSAVAGGIAIAMTLVLSFYFQRGYRILAVTEALGVALVSVWLVAIAIKGFPRLPGRLFAARPVVWVGSLSYGIYLYHGFAGELVTELFGAVGGVNSTPWFPTGPGFVLAIVGMGASVLLAWLSAVVIERPALRLKRYFDYAPAPR